MVSRQVSLCVNDAPIELNDFVQKYIGRVVDGIITSLRGTAEIERIELAIDEDRVSIVRNNDAVPLNPFATRIIRSTILGMVSALKGVSSIKKMQVLINKG